MRVHNPPQRLPVFPKETNEVGVGGAGVEEEREVVLGSEFELGRKVSARTGGSITDSEDGGDRAREEVGGTCE
jgi:hypothetical protein